MNILFYILHYILLGLSHLGLSHLSLSHYSATWRIILISTWLPSGLITFSRCSDHLRNKINSKKPVPQYPRWIISNRGKRHQMHHTMLDNTHYLLVVNKPRKWLYLTDSIPWLLMRKHDQEGNGTMAHVEIVLSSSEITYSSLASIHLYYETVTNLYESIGLTVKEVQKNLECYVMESML